MLASDTHEAWKLWALGRCYKNKYVATVFHTLICLNTLADALFRTSYGGTCVRLSALSPYTRGAEKFSLCSSVDTRIYSETFVNHMFLGHPVFS
jgi:hypothetical protein